MASSPWEHTRERRDFSISVRYLEASGAIKNVTKTIQAMQYIGMKTTGTDSPYKMRWDIANYTQRPTSAVPDIETAQTIANNIAKLFGATAVPTQMTFGGANIMRSDGK